MTRNLVRKFISLVLVALFLVGVAAACNGNYVEPSNGITWTFFGDTATRNDGACVVSGGYLTCNNGFNLPVTLDMSNCTLITTSLPWLTFQTLIGGQSTPKAHYAFLATTFYDYYIECGLGLGGNGDPSGLEAIECFID